MVKDPLAMQETQVRSLCQEDVLEKEMATHSNILAWEIAWTEDPGGLQSMGLQRLLSREFPGQSWVFFGRNDAKAETPVLWPPHVKS